MYDLNNNKKTFNESTGFLIISGRYYLNLTPLEDLSSFSFISMKITDADGGAYAIIPDPILPSSGKNPITIKFFIPGKDSPSFKSKDIYTGAIEYSAVDMYSHNTGKKSIKFTVTFITPPKPNLLPLFDGVTALGYDFVKCGDLTCENITQEYPLYFFNNTYYTNKDRLYVTGYNNPPANTIFRVGKRQGTFDTTKEISKLNKPNIEGLPVVFSNTKPGTTSFNITNAINSSSSIDPSDKYFNKYLSPFGNSFTSANGRLTFRTDYLHFGEYYKITSQVNSPLGLTYPYSTITLDVPIEINLSRGETLTMYDKPMPESFFGDNISLTVGQNYFYAAAKAELINPTDEFKIIYDNVTPIYVPFSEFQKAGSWSPFSEPISVNFSESDISSSGLNSNLLIIEINGVKYHSTSPRVKLESTDGIGEKIYTASISPIAADWEEGKYDVNVTVADYARNYANFSWSFEVDRCALKAPIVTFVNATGANSTSALGLNYMTSNPKKMLLDFYGGGEVFTNITLPKIRVFDLNLSPQVNITCAKTPGPLNRLKNHFECNITGELDSYAPQSDFDGKGRYTGEHYRINITATKIWSDLIEICGAEQTYIDIIIDRTPPANVSLTLKEHYARENSTYDKFVVHVDGEFGINTTIKYNPTGPLTTKYYLKSSTYNPSNLYTLEWNIPKYSPAYNTQSYRAFNITVCDFVGRCVENSNTNGSIYIDQSAPSISGLSIDIPESSIYLKNKPALNFTSKMQYLTIRGNLTSNNNDVVLIKIMPGNYSFESDSYLPAEFADIPFDTSTIKLFAIPITVKTTQSLASLLNNYTIYIEDKAGFSNSSKLIAYTDIIPLANPTQINVIS